MEIKVNTIENAPESAKGSLTKVKESFGFVPNLMGVFANSPQTVDAYLQISDQFGATSLSDTEKQVVLLSASVVNSCGYCVAAHTVISGMQQVPADVISALRDDKPIGDEKLEALRLFSKEVTFTRGNPSRETVERFAAAGYTAQNAVEVILGVTLKTLSNYVNHIAETPLDEAFSKAEWTPSASSATA